MSNNLCTYLLLCFQDAWPDQLIFVQTSLWKVLTMFVGHGQQMFYNVRTNL